MDSINDMFVVSESYNMFKDVYDYLNNNFETYTCDLYDAEDDLNDYEYYCGPYDSDDIYYEFNEEEADDDEEDNNDNENEDEDNSSNLHIFGFAYT
jgi:hypothetical protein